MVHLERVWKVVSEYTGNNKDLNTSTSFGSSVSNTTTMTIKNNSHAPKMDDQPSTPPSKSVKRRLSCSKTDERQKRPRRGLYSSGTTMNIACAKPYKRAGTFDEDTDSDKENLDPNGNLRTRRIKKSRFNPIPQPFGISTSFPSVSYGSTPTMRSPSQNLGNRMRTPISGATPIMETHTNATTSTPLSLIAEPRPR